MDSKKLKEISKIVDLCHKKGVLELKIDGIEIKLSPSFEPPKSNYKKKKDQETTEEVTTHQYTDEEMLLWSSAPAELEAR